MVSKLELLQSFVNETQGVSIDEFIGDSGWEQPSELCIDLLYESTTPNQVEYIKQKLKNLDSFRDVRTPVGYAKDLVMGWVVEDCILTTINDCGYHSQSHGGDARRDFISSSELITGSSDIRVTISNDRSVIIEITTDYTAYWRRTGFMDLRNDKYNNILKENGYILGIDFVNQEFCFFHPLETKSIYIETHSVWNKPAYQVDVKNSFFRKLSDLKEFMTVILNKGRERIVKNDSKDSSRTPSNTVDAWLSPRRN